jgi:hypothetical protein
MDRQVSSTILPSVVLSPAAQNNVIMLPNGTMRCQLGMLLGCRSKGSRRRYLIWTVSGNAFPVRALSRPGSFWSIGPTLARSLG